ncbi:hypothetical protein EYC84_003298 [Monilinia fructicola]|uniref:Uncharacterized protein n=1 Tax=Monilinia fructicola TaxID=38448 RepID=A0A5M9JT73_MONFR|nr:hypothetical protein EYC84_003298 [Monilinia fructicola]
MPSSPCNLQQGNVIASLSHRASPAGWGVQVGYIRGGGPQWCVASLPYFDLCLRLRTLPFTVLIVSHSLLRIYERIKERTNGRTCDITHIHLSSISQHRHLEPSTTIEYPESEIPKPDNHPSHLLLTQNKNK